MIKVFVKDTLELFGPPFLGLGILLVALFLVVVAGGSYTTPTRVRTLVQEAPSANPTAHRVRRLVGELSAADVLPHKWDGVDVVGTMERQRAELAIQWASPFETNDKWRVIVRPIGQTPRDQLIALAHQVGWSISFGKPWQIAAMEKVFQEETKSEKEGPVGLQNVVIKGVVDLGGPAVTPAVTLIANVISITVTFLPFLLGCSLMAREWENGTLSTLLVAPGVGWWSVVSGKMAVAIFAATVCFFNMLIVAVAYFDVPPRDDAAPAFGAQLIAMTTSTFLGIAASSLTRSSFQAYFLSALYIFCLIFLTGISFPIADSGLLVRVVAKLWPLTFSYPALYQWLVHGSSAWLHDGSLYWLTTQCGVSFAIMLASTSFARKQI